MQLIESHRPPGWSHFKTGNPPRRSEIDRNRDRRPEVNSLRADTGTSRQTADFDSLDQTDSKDLSQTPPHPNAAHRRPTYKNCKKRQERPPAPPPRPTARSCNPDDANYLNGSVRPVNNNRLRFTKILRCPIGGPHPARKPRNLVRAFGYRDGGEIEYRSSGSVAGGVN